MAKVTKTVVDKNLRDMIFADLFCAEDCTGEYVKINDRQYGILLTDLNGNQR